MPSDPPVAGRRPAWVDDDLFPFESRFVECDGQLVHYVDEGSGPTLLMVHGNPTWSFVYREVISRLRDRFRCVALDLPGFGLSSARPDFGHRPCDHADVLLAFLERLDLSGVTLVVQDWGGPIGLRSAELCPGRFKRLVISNTWAWPVNGDPHFERFSKAMGGAIGTALIERFNLFVNVMIPLGHRRRRVSRSEMTHYRMALATPARRRASAIFPRAITGERDFLAAVEEGLVTIETLPALILWGDRDLAFRARERERWEALLTHATSVVLAGAGHYVQSDAAEEFADAIREWIWSIS